MQDNIYLLFGRTVAGLDIDVSYLPARAVRHGNRVLAAVWLVLGLFFLILLLGSLGSAGDEGTVGWLLGAMLFLIGGARAALWHQAIKIDKEFVWSRTRGLFGWRTWQEPLRNYRGVRRYIQGNRLRSKTEKAYVISLDHPDADRSVRLFMATTDTIWRRRWEEYARVLDLPAIDGADD